MEYKTVAAPMKMVVKNESQMIRAVAQYASIINKEANDGWELHSIESIPVEVAPGCFGLKKGYTVNYNMLIFKRDN